MVHDFSEVLWVSKKVVYDLESQKILVLAAEKMPVKPNHCANMKYIKTNIIGEERWTVNVVKETSPKLHYSQISPGRNENVMTEVNQKYKLVFR